MRIRDAYTRGEYPTHTRAKPQFKALNVIFTIQTANQIYIES